MPAVSETLLLPERILFLVDRPERVTAQLPEHPDT